MLLHYYILHHIAQEINALAGTFLTECFTQERNTLHCVFERGRETHTLEMQLDSRMGAVFLRPEFHRARKNTVDVFPELIGRTLERAVLMTNERVLSLSLPPYTLHCVVFAGWNQDAERSSANAIVTLPATIQEGENNVQERIVAAFRSPSDLVKTPLRLNTASHQAFDTFPSETALEKALAGSKYLLGVQYAKEVVLRTQQHLGLEGALTLADEAVQTEKHVIESIAEEVCRECLSAKEFLLVRDERNKPLLSLIHPTNVHPTNATVYKIDKTFFSASEAVRFTLATMHREARFHALQSQAEAQCTKTLTKAQRALSAILQDTDGAERAQERQLWAEILLSQPNVQHKGLTELQTQDWSGETITIRLQPALTLRENAEEYFKKAGTAKATLKKREQRRQQQERIISLTNQALERLRGISTERELEQWMKEQGQSPSKALQTTSGAEQHRKTTRFREFPLEDDYTLYVGKTAADNDELTLRFAKPNDYWFHARGVPGSHAVLRSSAKDKKPPKQVVEQAASIAAYFSKARNAKLSPVAYTQKKYIRKPKGAAVGAVILEREEVVMVRPHVPAGLLGAEGDEN
ncbi:MAG: NFACT RNA binding domain-containing protein [Candidatus Kapabacteria bacterium]|jgi:predicted ribosome quality control (RQC) complex YloA/Tae2 family protein|nr:NFACT RNA binding domain-containing protein [Candidatus Kapabacteria bacterium]